MASNREVKYEKPTCGYCGKLTRHLTTAKQARVCENGHRITVKRGARH